MELKIKNKKNGVMIAVFLLDFLFELLFLS